MKSFNLQGPYGSVGLNGGGKPGIIMVVTDLNRKIPYDLSYFNRFWTCNLQAVMDVLSAVSMLGEKVLTVTVCDQSFDIIMGQAPDYDLPAKPPCDCGGEKTKTPHSSWCSSKS